MSWVAYAFTGPAIFLALVASFYYFTARHQRQAGSIICFWWHPLVFVLAGAVGCFVLAPLTRSSPPALSPALGVGIGNTLFLLGVVATVLAVYRLRSLGSAHVLQFFNIPAAAYMWFVCMVAITGDGP
jgi:hypothetical protein